MWWALLVAQTAITFEPTALPSRPAEACVKSLRAYCVAADDRPARADACASYEQRLARLRDTLGVVLAVRAETGRCGRFRFLELSPNDFGGERSLYAEDGTLVARSTWTDVLEECSSPTYTDLEPATLECTDSEVINLREIACDRLGFPLDGLLGVETETAGDGRSVVLDLKAHLGTTFAAPLLIDRARVSSEVERESETTRISLRLRPRGREPTFTVDVPLGCVRRPLTTVRLTFAREEAPPRTIRLKNMEELTPRAKVEVPATLREFRPVRP